MAYIEKASYIIEQQVTLILFKQLSVYENQHIYIEKIEGKQMSLLTMEDCEMYYDYMTEQQIYDHTFWQIKLA